MTTDLAPLRIRIGRPVASTLAGLIVITLFAIYDAAAVARTTTERRRKVAKNWLYLAPPSFLILCTSLGVLERLAR